MANGKNQPPDHELDVVVLKECNGKSDKKKSVVSKGKVKVKSGEIVKWTNHTYNEVTLFFPDRRLFVQDVQVVHIQRDGDVELTVANHSEFKKGDRFPYAIHSFESNNFAVGSREPEIIYRR